MRALIITSQHELRWTDVTALDEFQYAVGGFIEHVLLNDGCSMFVNEEGRLKGLPLNLIASSLVSVYSMIEGPIVGDVIIAGPNDGHGNSTDLLDTAATVVMVQGIAALSGGTFT